MSERTIICDATLVLTPNSHDPTRAINTHTYEFEYHIVFFQVNYAILSHTLSRHGRDITVDTVEDVFAEAKEEQLNTLLAKLVSNIDSAEGVEL